MKCVWQLTLFVWLLFHLWISLHSPVSDTRSSLRCSYCTNKLFQRHSNKAKRDLQVYQTDLWRGGRPCFLRLPIGTISRLGQRTARIASKHWPPMVLWMKLSSMRNSPRRFDARSIVHDAQNGSDELPVVVQLSINAKRTSRKIGNIAHTSTWGRSIRSK